MKKCFNIIDNSVEYIIYIIYFVMIFVVLVQVITRYFFKNPFMWAEEFARLCFIWLLYLTCPLVILNRRDIAIDYVTINFSEKIKLYLKFAIDIIILPFFILIFFKSAELTQKFVNIYSHTMHFLPRAVFYLPISIGFFLATLNLIRRDIKLFHELKNINKL